MKPIFNTEMVRAILDGRKSETRQMSDAELADFLSGIWSPNGIAEWLQQPVEGGTT